MKFEELFEYSPRCIAFAPGRVNLIGEHIDYAGGKVLPIAIHEGITVAAGFRPSAAEFRVFSDAYPDDGIQCLTRADAEGYFQMIVARSADETNSKPADLLIMTDLPIGRGLSSSAALCVALTSALSGASGRKPFDCGLDLARACQRTEIAATGVACGLMDQYASVFGKAGHAILFDTTKLIHEWLHFDPEDAALVVIDSGQPRELAESQYNKRRTDLADALEFVATDLGYSLQQLFSDFDIVRLDGLLSNVPNPFQRRLRHVVTEQWRVEAFARMLDQGGDIPGFMLSESHWSLSSDYAVSTREIDSLQVLLAKSNGVIGSRIHGGGFGGSMIAFVKRGSLPGSIDRALSMYANSTGLRPSWGVVAAGDGARLWLDEKEPKLVRDWLAGIEPVTG